MAEIKESSYKYSFTNSENGNDPDEKRLPQGVLWKRTRAA